MRKFNLFSRSALASMAAAAGLGTTVDDPKPGDEDEDPDAGPVPDEGAEPTVDEADAAAPSKDKKPGCEDDDDGAEAGASAEAADVVPVADAVAVAADQFAAGRKAERERTSAVLGSAEGKANPAMAGWMLSSSPDASATAIIAQLKTMPGQSASGGQVIPDTAVDLGKPGAAAALADGSTSASDDVWADVQGTAKSAPVVSSDAGRATVAAIAAGGQTVNVGGNSTSTPAVVPTGN